ncbi:hypothetical protein DB29_00531 [Shouchella clausii]|nr:hypothetical protein DB29_00531 [Shouchella clausii]
MGDLVVGAFTWCDPHFQLVKSDKLSPGAIHKPETGHIKKNR